MVGDGLCGVLRHLHSLPLHADSATPTVVSVYNYMQPLVSVSVSVAAGLAVFKTSQALAAILVFSGVWFVVKSKSKHDMSKA